MKTKYIVITLLVIIMLAMPVSGLVTWREAFIYAILGSISGGLGSYIYAYFAQRNK